MVVAVLTMVNEVSSESDGVDDNLGPLRERLREGQLKYNDGADGVPEDPELLRMMAQEAEENAQREKAVDDDKRLRGKMLRNGQASRSEHPTTVCKGSECDKIIVKASSDQRGGKAESEDFRGLCHNCVLKKKSKKKSEGVVEEDISGG